MKNVNCQDSKIFRKLYKLEITNNTNNDSISVGDFFVKRGGDVLKATEIAKKPRRNISSVIAGKAITFSSSQMLTSSSDISQPLSKLTTLVFSFEGPGCCSLLDCFLIDFDKKA
jgi:hypothetical protein